MKQKYYLSNTDTLDDVCYHTGLSEGEVEEIVGRFPETHHNVDWRGKLRGEFVVSSKWVRLRHHFTKKVLFEYKYTEGL